MVWVHSQNRIVRECNVTSLSQVHKMVHWSSARDLPELESTQQIALKMNCLKSLKIEIPKISKLKSTWNQNLIKHCRQGSNLKIDVLNTKNGLVDTSNWLSIMKLKFDLIDKPILTKHSNPSLKNKKADWSMHLK